MSIFRNGIGLFGARQPAMDSGRRASPCTWFGRLAFCVVALLAAMGTAAMAEPAALVKRTVMPSTTDPAIDQYDFAHTVYINKLTPAQGNLFVFLPGTGALGSGYTGILQTAANLGIPAIGLTYPNSVMVNSICKTVADSDCHEKVRAEIITGTNDSPVIVVDQTNSIKNRLVKLLAYLHERYPAEGWGQFIDAYGDIDWSNVVAGGHSQGAGHAALIAKNYRVERCLMFN